jgi:hypothetical protein
MALGAMIFGPFEEHTPLPIRLLKFAILLGFTAIVTRFAGPGWGLAPIVFMFALGIGFHAWWTHKHGINFFRPEPRDRYYALRGWQQ